MAGVVPEIERQRGLGREQAEQTDKSASWPGGGTISKQPGGLPGDPRTSRPLLTGVFGFAIFEVHQVIPEVIPFLQFLEDSGFVMLELGLGP